MTDNHRWWRVVFEPDNFDATDLIVEMTSGIRRYYYAEFSNAATLVSLKAINDDRMWFPARFAGQPPDPVVATFRLITPKPGQLTIEGYFEGRHIQASLHRTDMKFLLLERGFHWINDRPYWAR